MHQDIAWANFPLVEEYVQPKIVEIGGKRPCPILIGTGVGDEDVPGLGHNVFQHGKQYYPGTLLKWR
jgi:hypothetical protein